MTYRIVTFYKFVSVSYLDALRSELLALCKIHGLLGTILLAPEGINSTLAGTFEATDIILETLRSKSEFQDLEHKESFADNMPFKRIKVKIKKELIPLGIEQIDPSRRVGTYVEPNEWNRLISDPSVTVIDTRNEYEVGIGSFRRAQNPHTETFREFPSYVQTHLDPTQHRKIAMFCTGGIRCEKATAYLLEQGFEEVYHLKGGILKYLEDIPAEDSLWNGECFVFDQRVAVKHGLTLGTYDMCFGCGHPVSAEDKASELYEPGVSCPYCAGAKS